MGPLVRDSDAVLSLVLAPLRSVPDKLCPAARFGVDGLLPATVLARRLRTPEARGAARRGGRPLAAARCPAPLTERVRR